MNQFLRGLTPGQQVGLLFVVVFGLLLLVSLTSLVLSLRDRHEDDLRTQNIREFNSLLKNHVGDDRRVLGRLEPGRNFCDRTVRHRGFLRVAGIHHAIAHPPGRSPQPGARVFCRAAAAVCLGDQPALRPGNRVHTGVCLPGDPGCQCAGERSAAFSGAYRQAPVGHHGVRLRHQSCAGFAAAQVSELPGQERVSGVFFWCSWCKAAWWCSIW